MRSWERRDVFLKGSYYLSLNSIGEALLGILYLLVEAPVQERCGRALLEACQDSQALVGSGWGSWAALIW